MVSTVENNAVGLGADLLYQSYFVCLKETSKSTVIEYGKSQGTTEFGDVYLTMIDTDHPLFVRFYSFGNGEKQLEVVDAHIISRHLTKAKCRGDTMYDKETNMCVQHCHELCDPTQGNYKDAGIQLEAVNIEGGRSLHQGDPRGRTILTPYVFCIQFPFKKSYKSVETRV